MPRRGLQVIRDGPMGNRGLWMLFVEFERAFQRFFGREHGRVVAVGNACC
jgi:hypothetical protein